ncbi:BlaI/MecI/CopY family transcriptional regulator [uncultured Paraglaciecola sp.]|uniref:BlaI/MecI/CopY family transcriptional regulator n=1 Tax=uncultured Paraglaciecola sp. TaxID=1765024 RepID=UPI002630CCDD|nr:BlaI/MecI/CopY family transcriptional regulator [uncultured Paraglaciecola sp.]
MNIKNKTSAKPPLSAPVLGQREIETLGLFWRSQESTLSATDILNILKLQAKDPEDVISINTIQSTIERLWKKRLLSRRKQGKAYIYTSVYSKQEVMSSLIAEISDALGEGDDTAIMSGIFTFLKSRNTNNQVDVLRALEQESTINQSSLVK